LAVWGSRCLNRCFTGSDEISPSKYFDNPCNYFINPLKYFG